jgi:hypothetical protein
MQQTGHPLARARTALALACALHAAAFLALSSRAPARLYPVRAARPEKDEIELDLEFLTRPTPPQLAPSTAAAIPRSAPEQHRVAGRQRGHTQTPDVGAPAEDTGDPEPRGTQSDAPKAPALPVDLGLGADAWRMWARTPEAEAARTARMTAAPSARPPSSTGGLQEGLEEHDRQVGLGASGPVISALYRAAHNPVAPETGVAHFRVTVLKSGAVEVSLSDATDQLPAWRAVAKNAAEALKRTLPRIPDPRSGARMLIEITAQEIFPNGVKQKELYGPRLEVKAPRFRSVAAAQANLKDLNPLAGERGGPPADAKANVDLPGVFVSGKGKVCGYRAGITALGPLLQGGCDLANLGAKPQRMVHTRVREETLF